jgi:primary-amine oxidase
MTIDNRMSSAMAKIVQHPLDPLTPQEIDQAVTLVRQHQALTGSVRFATVMLNEPSKSTALNFNPGDPIQREAFLILLDNVTGYTYEVVVSLTQKMVTTWTHVPHVQPRIMADEMAECEATVKANADFQAILAKRGITDIDNVVIDTWAIGNFGLSDEVVLVAGRANR